jgi:hypothetical protein
MNKINKKDILLFRDTVNTQAPVDKDGVSRIRKLKRKPPFTEYSYVIDGTIAGEEVVSYAKSGISGKMINKMKRGHIDNKCPEAGRDKFEISPLSQQVGILFSIVE